MNSKKEIHISVLSVGGIFCRFSFSFSMATPVEEKKLMSGLESNYTKEGCAISYGFVSRCFFLFFLVSENIDFFF